MDDGTLTVVRYACSHSHMVSAWIELGNDEQSALVAPVDLTGYFCPICMGAIVGHENMIDSRILARVEEDVL